MGKFITVVFEPEGRKVRIDSGTSIFEAARKSGVIIRSECGGRGLCGKCRVIVADKNTVTEIRETEKKHLSLAEISSGYRLACCAVLKNDVLVMIPEESRVGARKIQVFGLESHVPLSSLVKKFYITLIRPTLFDAKPDLERVLAFLKDKFGLDKLKIDYEVLKKLPSILRRANWKITVTLWNERKIIAVEEGDTSNEAFGLAVDIGTSKIVGCLVDLATGRTVGVSFIENPQILYGEDVVSRIAFAANNGKKLKILQKLILKGVNDVINYACAQASVNPNNVYEATIVGNTVMHHFFLGITPKYVAVSPFTPSLRKPLDIKAKELNIKICPEGNIHILPVIAGFVGADAVADVLSSGIYKSKELSLLLDIGTNTEVFLGNSQDILSCSCASGPAFEGAHIKNGMKAVTGAIEKISIRPDSNYKVEYETVDDAAPTGLCGSAMIDIVAEMFKHGIINKRGRFNAHVKTPRLRMGGGDSEFVVVWKGESGTGRDITVTQKDIDEIQLAKAAIFAGCWILMKRKHVDVNALNQVFIAGSFGSYINPGNAKLIGLVPDVPTEKIKFVGNTALTGAKMALISKEARKTAETLSNRVRYIELACDHDFRTEFADAMFIPHKNLDRFPSVKKYLSSFEENG
ncbi:MAG: ASKHA domain-containing protein [Candidatus Bathyarchaeales archaeon]